MIATALTPTHRATARRIVAGVSLLLAASLTACSDDPPDDARSTDPAASLAGGTTTIAAGDETADLTPEDLAPTEIPGDPVNKFTLDIGDCFALIDDLDNGLPTTITTKIPCEEPHGYEIFARLTYPAEYPSPYPGEAVIRDYAVASCYREFAGWVGREYELSELDIDVIVPTRENFEDSAARYRGIHCWVERYDGDLMTGSSRQSGW